MGRNMLRHGEQDGMINAIRETRPAANARGFRLRLASVANVWVRPFASLVVLWSVLELPWELGAGAETAQLAALGVAKSMLVFVAWRMVKGSAWARYGFLLLCGASILAIAPALPGEYANLPSAFVMSLGECIIKGSALVVVLLAGNKLRRFRGTP